MKPFSHFPSANESAVKFSSDVAVFLMIPSSFSSSLWEIFFCISSATGSSASIDFRTSLARPFFHSSLVVEIEMYYVFCIHWCCVLSM
mmetsp:Transcript_1962/g.2992  ORF Transcript_1962/g.2992 Transcript_1962/m.2992 type:complete len:88 (+) Transcript_1962:1898-2161(+)